MEEWFQSTNGFCAKLLKGGLGILLLIGALYFSTGLYFLEKIDSAGEERNIVCRIRLSMLEARTAEQDFLQQDLVNINFYKG